MTLSIAYKFATGQFDEAIAEIYQPIAAAGTAALKEAAEDAKAKARADIAAAGFSKRWQNAFRADIYPKEGISANAAVHFYHSVPYADVFASGAVIRGKPKLWVPLSSTPTKVYRKKLTPKRFSQQIGPLFPIKSRSGIAMLAATMAVPKKEVVAGPPYRVRLSALRRGAEGPVTPTGRKRFTVTVPLFVGIDTVTIKKRLNIYPIIQAAADDLPRLYLKHLKAG